MAETSANVLLRMEYVSAQYCMEIIDFGNIYRCEKKVMSGALTLGPKEGSCRAFQKARENSAQPSQLLLLWLFSREVVYEPLSS